MSKSISTSARCASICSASTRRRSEPATSTRARRTRRSASLRRLPTETATGSPASLGSSLVATPRATSPRSRPARRRRVPTPWSRRSSWSAAEVNRTRLTSSRAVSSAWQVAAKGHSSHSRCHHGAPGRARRGSAARASVASRSATRSAKRASNCASGVPRSSSGASSASHQSVPARSTTPPIGLGPRSRCPAPRANGGGARGGARRATTRRPGAGADPPARRRARRPARRASTRGTCPCPRP